MEVTQKDKKPSFGQVLLGLALIVALFLLVAWIGVWAWNDSMPKMFSGVKSVKFGSMIAFLILLLIVGAFLCRPSGVVVMAQK